MYARIVWALVAPFMATSPAPAPVDGTFHLERAAGKARTLQVRCAGGDVRVRGQRGTQIVVDAARSLGGPGCKVQLRRAGADFAVEAADPSGKPCLIDLQIKVPPGLQLDIDNGAGNVFVSGARASLRLALAQGSAVVGGLFARVDAHVAEGSLSVQGLAGDANIDVVRGNVQLFVAPQARDRPVAIALHVGKGNATLISAGPDADVQLSVLAGQLKNSLADGGAASNLRVRGEVSEGNFVAKNGGG